MTIEFKKLITKTIVFLFGTLMILFSLFSCNSNSSTNNFNSDSLIVFYDTNTSLAGYKNPIGNIVITPKFDYGDDFSDNLAIVVQSGKFGYIDKSGSQIIDCTFEQANKFNNDFAIVRKNAKWILINNQGKTIKELDYEELTQMDDLYLISKFDEKQGKYLWGYLNYKGDEIITPQIATPFYFHNGLAKLDLYHNGKWDTNEDLLSYSTFHSYDSCVYADTSLKIDLKIKCSKAADFQEGLAAIVINDKIGFINTQGKLVIPATYDYDYNLNDLPFFSNGLAKVLKNGWYGYINNEGLIVIPFKYNEATDFYENGIANVSINGKQGAINRKGEVIILPIYSKLGQFYNDVDVVPAKLSEKFGFVDKNGKVIVPFTFDSVGFSYNNGYPFGRMNNRWAVLNKNGKPITPFQFETIHSDFRDGLACVKLNGKFGFISQAGKTIIDFKFTEAPRFVNGTIILDNGELHTVYDKRGNEVYSYK